MSWFYHRNSEARPGLEGERPEFQLSWGRDSCDKAGVPLGAIARVKAPLIEAIRRRRSCRTFGATPVAIAELSAILTLGYGFGVEVEDQDPNRWLRPVPSAGGTYSLELGVIVSNVANIAAGVYRYRPIDNSLEPLAREAEESAPATSKLIDVFLGQEFLSDAAAIIIMSAVFARCMGKYDDRGYRYILIEAGHVGQNMMLTAEALGLSTVALGGFQDLAVAEIFQQDPEVEAPVYAVALGYAA